MPAGLSRDLLQLFDDVLGRGAATAGADGAAFEDVVGERVDVVLQLGGGDGSSGCGRRDWLWWLVGESGRRKHECDEGGEGESELGRA